MSKKVHVTLTQAQFDALMNGQKPQPAKQQKQQGKPQPKPKGGGLDGLTVLLLLVLAALVFLLLTPKQTKADEIDWSFTSDYSTALEHCNARALGTPYPVLGGSQEYNCMLHNGYTQIVNDGQLVGWGDGRGNQYLGEEVLYVK